MYVTFLFRGGPYDAGTAGSARCGSKPVAVCVILEITDQRALISRTRQTDGRIPESLRNAIGQLDRAVEAYAAEPAAEFVRDAVIARFTFSFSQSVTTLGRYLESVYFLPDARMMSPRQLIRHAARRAVIANCEAWLRHVENRNRVSHAYLSRWRSWSRCAGQFAADARALLAAMERGIADGG